MIIQGDTLCLREAKRSDSEIIHRWENDSAHWLVSNREAPITIEEIVRFIDQGGDIYGARQFRWMMDLGDVAVGCIDLYEFDPKNARVGIGVLVDPEFRGRGLGADALRMVMDYCFNTLEVRCVFAEVLASNEASIRLFESHGFERTGVRKEWLWDGFKFQNQHFYQKMRSD